MYLYNLKIMAAMLFQNIALIYATHEEFNNFFDESGFLRLLVHWQIYYWQN